MSAADEHRAEAIDLLRHSVEDYAGGLMGGANALSAQAGASAMLAVEARLGEVVDHLAEIARLLRPRTVDLGPLGVIANPNGLSAEDIAAVYDHARSVTAATARQAGGR
ncbi:hypothetical protein ACWESM_18710 [Nocardia sp. NPDC003999]